MAKKPTRTVLARWLDILAVRPRLARVLSDTLIVLGVCVGVVGFFGVSELLAQAKRPAPLHGFAELHARPVRLDPPQSARATGQDRAPANRPARPASVPARKTAAPSDAAAHDTARPLTGEALSAVVRLTRAVGLQLPPSTLAGGDATRKTAAALAAAGKPVTAKALAALQANPRDRQVVHEVTLQFRGFVTAALPSTARPNEVATPEAGRAEQATSSPVRGPASGERARSARAPDQGAQGRADRAEAARPAVERASPARTEIRPTAATPATREDAVSRLPSSPAVLEEQRLETPPSLVSFLDNPPPLNSLRMMAAQPVTPLTPEN